MKYLSSFILLLFFLAGKAQEKLPRPAGPYATGTRVYNFKDNGRYDSIHKSGRYIIVQLWYPGIKRPDSELADYIEDKRLVDFMLKTRYYNQDSGVLACFYKLKTNSFGNCEMMNTGKKMPLVFFSEGLGVARANYTSIYEALASRGIVVAAIDHVYAGTTILPDGSIAEVGQYADTSVLPMIKDCIKDISFVTNQIFNKKTPISRFLFNSINPLAIGAMGHSQGGNVAMESTIADKRIKFSINLDGGFFDNMPGRHVNKPCLVIRESPDYSDEELKKKGRTREGMEAMGKKGDSIFDRSLAGSAMPAYNIKIRGTGHFSFSDAPFIITDMITRFGGKIIDANRNMQILSTCIVSFIETARHKEYSQELVNKMQSFNEVFYIKTYRQTAMGSGRKQ